MSINGREARTIMFRFVALIALSISLLFGAAHVVLAQDDEPIVAGVDRLSLSTDETVELTIVVSVKGQTSVPRPEIPDLEGFYVVGNSSSTQTTIVNNEVSNDVIFRYRLQPYQTGTLTIPPTTLVMDGQSYTTDPIAIEVTQGTGQTQSGGNRAPSDIDVPSSIQDNELFVDAVVDNETPYVGEQIQYIFRYYEAADALRMPSLFASQPDYTPPAMTGFWTEGDTDVVSYRVAENGRIYTVTELNSILFPTSAGETVVEPAEILIPGFGFQGDVRLQTDPVSVQVKPLPDGAPESFTGAVGEFGISAGVDKAETTVGEPIMLEVTVSGEGNIGVAGDPIWPEIDGWRAFDTESTLDTRIEDDAVVGSRTFQTLILPTDAGEYTIPAIEYSYFDPVAELYHTVATAPIAVSVGPGVAGAQAAAAPTAIDAVPTESDSLAVLAEENLSEDGAELSAAEVAVSRGLLKPAPEILEAAVNPLPAQPWYWAMWALPLAVLVGGFGWQRRRDYLQNNAATVRASRALKNARRSLGDLQRHSQDSDAQYAGVYAILTEYLSAKIDTPTAGMTRATLVELLEEQGVEGDLISRTCDCLDASEYGRYSPAGMQFGSAAELVNETEALVSELDSHL